MQTDIGSDLHRFISTWKTNEKYFEMLRLVAGLSDLFSDSKVPYLDYRLAENIFCRYYKAINNARSCTAYDARIGRCGIGIKTFILKGNDSSMEKIAEFDKARTELNELNGMALALKAEFKLIMQRFRIRN